MYVSSKKAQDFYNVSGEALRKWAINGKIKTIKTEGGHRRFLLPETSSKGPKSRKIIYARVSSYKQKKDLKRQIRFLRKRFPDHELIYDYGSGINFERKGLKRLLESVFEGSVKEVVVAFEDRLSRFGFDLFQFIFERFGTKIIIVKKRRKQKADIQLAEHIIALITIFTAKYYGQRSYDQKILQKN